MPLGQEIPTEITDGVMIIDDIYTTGATMDTCARILMEMGAEAVYGAVVCIGVS